MPSPRDPKEVWRTFAENFHLFRGTPVRRGEKRRAGGGLASFAMCFWSCFTGDPAVQLLGGVAVSLSVRVGFRFPQSGLWVREALARNFNITEKCAWRIPLQQRPHPRGYPAHRSIRPTTGSDRALPHLSYRASPDGVL